MSKQYNLNVWDIQFAFQDQDGNYLENDDGSIKLYSDGGNLDCSYIAESVTEDELFELPPADEAVVSNDAHTGHLLKGASEIRSGDYEYRNEFFVLSEHSLAELPDDIDEILTAWNHCLSLDDVKEQGDEVWSDHRIVASWIESEIPIENLDVIARYVGVINLQTILDAVKPREIEEQAS